MKEMSEAIALDPENTRKYIVALVLSKLTGEEIKEVIPRKPTALLLFGNYQEEKGDMDEALDTYLDALSVMKSEGAVKPDAYYKITEIYEKKGLLKEALAFSEEGVKDNPLDYSLRMRLAGLYEKLGVPNRAKEEYKKVLALRPFDEQASGRLKELNMVH